jgi:hypothetical protein
MKTGHEKGCFFIQTISNKQSRGLIFVSILVKQLLNVSRVVERGSLRSDSWNPRAFTPMRMSKNNERFWRVTNTLQNSVFGKLYYLILNNLNLLNVL